MMCFRFAKLPCMVPMAVPFAAHRAPASQPPQPLQLTQERQPKTPHVSHAAR